MALGLVVGVAAMVGDAASSFVKRRLGRASSSRAFGLDQIPEALFPALVCTSIMGLTAINVPLTVGLFTFGEIILSRLLFRIHVQEQPY